MSFLKPKPATSSSVQSSLSENTNNDFIKSQFGGMVGAGSGATNVLQQLLLGGGSGAGGGTVAAPGAEGGAPMAGAPAGGAGGGFQNYLQMAGFAPAMRQLAQGVTGQGAAAGILNSGPTAKALQSRGAELNQGFFNNYLQQLNNLSSQGLQAGGLIANTGQKSTSSGTSKSNGGGPSTAGSIASTVAGIASIFSDRRLKRDIEKIGEEPDGLGIYRYRYIGQTARIVGVMADEVARLRPWALGRRVAGYSTVNYGAL